MKMKLVGCVLIFMMMALIPVACAAPWKYTHPWFLYGGAKFVMEGQAPDPWAIELTSKSVEPYWSGLAFNPPSGRGILFEDIWRLSFDYYIKTGNNFGGSPRFTLFSWNGISWDVIYLYLGTPVFSALPTNQWVSTGNFIGDTEPRFQIGWLGWYMTDYAEALALAADKPIHYIYLDCDGGWGQDQVMLVDNVAVNDFVLLGRAPGFE